jgi:RNA polymerase sigma factor (sigma-70 family)
MSGEEREAGASVPAQGAAGVPAQGGAPEAEGGAALPQPGDAADEGSLPPSDALLTAAVRAGDDTAFEELYRRHAAAVRRYARTCCRETHTAEDLAGEVFARTLQALRSGRGPDVAVRAYLLTAVRNIAATWARTDRREHLVDDFAAFAASSSAVAQVDITDPGADDRTMAMADRSMVVRAFARLDEADRMVLWHTAVEEEAPREVAVLLGKTANATAVQAHRARERLAAEFLQEHVSGAQSGECAAYAGRLGQLARGSLGKRASADLRAHLKECDRCSAAYLELVDLNAHLRAALPGGLLLWVGAGYFAAAAAAAGVGAAAAGAGAGAGAAAGGGAAGSGSGGAAAGGAASEGVGLPAKIGVATAVAVAAGVGLALALTGSGHPPSSPAARRPPTPQPAASAPQSVNSPPPRTAPPLAPVAAASPPPRPRATPAAPAPSPSPAPAAPASTPPSPSASPTPSPSPAPPPPPPAAFYADSFRYAVEGSGAAGPTLRASLLNGVWQRPDGLSSGGQRYARGITVHAPAATVVDLNDACTSFDAYAGLDDLSLGLGAVRFSVQDDATGRVLWSSGRVEGGAAAVPVRVPLAGVRSVRLVVTPLDGTFLVDVADWADARFMCTR